MLTRRRAGDNGRQRQVVKRLEKVSGEFTLPHGGTKLPLLRDGFGRHCSELLLDEGVVIFRPGWRCRSAAQQTPEKEVDASACEFVLCDGAFRMIPLVKPVDDAEQVESCERG